MEYSYKFPSKLRAVPLQYTPIWYWNDDLDAIKELMRITEEGSTIDFRLDIDHFDEKMLYDKLKLTIYRIVQEQFSNIPKHSQATSVVVRLAHENEKIILSIKDNGRGIDPSKKGDGIGIIHVKTRASLVDGTVRIVSSPGNGYELEVSFAI